MYLLHSVLIPSSRKVTKDENGKKSIIKYGAKDSQNPLKICETTLEMETLLKNTVKREGPIYNHVYCLLVHYLSLNKLWYILIQSNTWRL